MVLFVDNDRAHEAKALQQLLEKQNHQIQLGWLPPYSPELNPQEDVWQHVRRRVTHNHYYGNIGALLKAAEQLDKELEGYPAQVLRLLKKWARLISS